MHKRKRRKSFRGDDWEHTTGTSHLHSTFNAEHPNSTACDSCLYIQAYEADVIHGPPAISARSLEYQHRSLMTDTGSHSRSGLIQWGPQECSEATDTVDTQRLDQPLLWVDRYDVRLLLDDLPDFESEKIQARLRPLSPSGWSDLPSDSEDAFFLTPDELEDYRREKRRRLINHDQEERLRVLAAVDDQEDPDPWGGSDEEPDETQRELIRRTASHITSSPNPAQLEMRILTNYGTDERFAFLRGRWSRAWRTEKERAKQHWAEEAKKTHPPITLTPLGGLANYGDSDSDEEESVDGPAEEPKDVVGVPRTEDSHSNEDVVREARRARAREWSARRRAEQSSRPDQT